MNHFNWPDLDWPNLAINLIAVILGWLANILKPAPGTQRKK